MGDHQQTGMYEQALADSKARQVPAEGVIRQGRHFTAWDFGGGDDSAVIQGEYNEDGSITIHNELTRAEFEAMWLEAWLLVFCWFLWR